MTTVTPIRESGDWDPGRYLEFAEERLRPAVDLLSRINMDAPAVIYDLGCGTGSVTALLARRWPLAWVTGVDSSPAMLAAARETLPQGHWQTADIGHWSATPRGNLVVSNAALQWLDDHESLMPRVMAQVAPGGLLAVQMPRNYHAPSHRAMAEAIAAGPWEERLTAALRALPASGPVATPTVYYDILAPHCAALEIWETEYLHVLDGESPVVDWTMGSALRPVLDALEPSERDDFVAEYTARIAAAYPRRSDGRTLFPFRRLFILATHP